MLYILYGNAFSLLYVFYPFPSVAIFLIPRVSGEKANVRDQQYDATLLHWAVNEGHVPTVEHLLKCGADVRLRDGKQ